MRSYCCLEAASSGRFNPCSFASESAIDEIASSFAVDPVAFRLRYLTEPRIIDVLSAATKQAKWQPRPVTITATPVRRKATNYRRFVFPGRGAA